LSDEWPTEFPGEWPDEGVFQGEDAGGHPAQFRWRRVPHPEAFNLIDVLNALTDPQPGPDDDEMVTLFTADQEDRKDGTLDDEVVARDRIRRTRGLAKLAAGELHSPADYFHLAMLLQHGAVTEHFHLAHELARRAAHGHPPATWLVAATMDRWLMNQGLPQKYGTQYRDVGHGFELYPVDPATTDEERRRWQVPTLAQAQARAAAFNRS
jgi:hypothetical protein